MQDPEATALHGSRTGQRSVISNSLCLFLPFIYCICTGSTRNVPQFMFWTQQNKLHSWSVNFQKHCALSVWNHLERFCSLLIFFASIVFLFSFSFLILFRSLKTAASTASNLQLFAFLTTFTCLLAQLMNVVFVILKYMNQLSTIASDKDTFLKYLSLNHYPEIYLQPQSTHSLSRELSEVVIRSDVG